MEHLDTLVCWLQSRAFQAFLLIVVFIGSAMVVTEIHARPYSRQQKNAAILAFFVIFLVIASVVLGFISK